MDLTAITIPEEHGGIGLGFLELCVVAEEMGRAIAQFLTLQVFIASTAISSSMMKKRISKTFHGEMIGTFTSEELGTPTSDNAKTTSKMKVKWRKNSGPGRRYCQSFCCFS